MSDYIFASERLGFRIWKTKDVNLLFGETKKLFTIICYLLTLFNRFCLHFCKLDKNSRITLYSRKWDRKPYKFCLAFF